MALFPTDHSVYNKYFQVDSNYSQDSDNESCINIETENLHSSLLDQSFFRDALDIKPSCHLNPYNSCSANILDRKVTRFVNNNYPHANVSINKNIQKMTSTNYKYAAPIYSCPEPRMQPISNINPRYQSQFPINSQYMIQSQNYIINNHNPYQVYMNSSFPTNLMQAPDYNNHYYPNEKQKLLYYLKEQLHTGSLLDLICSTKSEQLLGSIIKVQFTNEDYNFVCDIFLSLKSMHIIFTCESSKKLIKHFLRKIGSDRIIYILSEIREHFEHISNHEIGIDVLLFMVSNLKEGTEVKALTKIVQAHIKNLCTNKLSCALVIKIIQLFKANGEVICNSIIQIQSSLINSPNGIFIVSI
jgi:hypothetical protein